MFQSLEEFYKSWEFESGGTQKIIDAVTDESLAQPVTDDHRTLGRIAWHVVTAIPEMMNRTGLTVTSVAAEDALPKTAAEIQKKYADVSAELRKKVESEWSDESLKAVDDMYGEQWPRGMTLGILINHQTHHRGQMTVLMRQAGLKVPGIYGPSLEEWEAYGMQAPPV